MSKHMVKAFKTVFSFQLSCLLIPPPFHWYLKGSHFTKDKHVQKDYILGEQKTVIKLSSKLNLLKRALDDGQMLFLVRGIRSLLLIGKSVFLQKALWCGSKAGIFRETTLVEQGSELHVRRRFQKPLRKMGHGLLEHWVNLILLYISHITSVLFMLFFMHFQYHSLFETEQCPYFEN